MILLKVQRQQKILDILKNKEILKVTQLAKLMDTSMMTISRDLEQLEDAGLAKRIHGGVMLTNTDDSVQQKHFYERYGEYMEEKSRIGHFAASLVYKGANVFFDAGTTTLEMINHLPRDIEITAMSPGLLASVELCSFPNVTVVSIGGIVHKSSFCTTNSMALDQIRLFNADLAFISTRAFRLPDGAQETQLPLIEVKREIVKTAQHVVLLADHNKFDNTGLAKSVPASDIDEIITDIALNEEIAADIVAAGIKLTMV